MLRPYATTGAKRNEDDDENTLTVASALTVSTVLMSLTITIIPMILHRQFSLQEGDVQILSLAAAESQIQLLRKRK